MIRLSRTDSTARPVAGITGNARIRAHNYRHAPTSNWPNCSVKTRKCTNLHGPIAPGGQGVVGSNPAIPTKNARKNARRRRRAFLFGGKVVGMRGSAVARDLPRRSSASRPRSLAEHVSAAARPRRPAPPGRARRCRPGPRPFRRRRPVLRPPSASRRRPKLSKVVRRSSRGLVIAPRGAARRQMRHRQNAGPTAAPRPARRARARQRPRARPIRAYRRQ